jgi:hypothetical protein
MGRRCTNCRRDLPETSYYWVSKASGRLRGQCRECMRARKIEQRDPAWTPVCSRCGEQLTERVGSGRRLCVTCFDATYDTEDRRLNGAHRIRLKPCSLCGGRKQRFERGKVCSACRPWLRYAASLRQFGLTPAEYVAVFQAQNGRCYVCGAAPGVTRLCIDHDHAVPDVRRSIRGLLCDECNYSRLPRFQEDVTMLRRAVDYLVDPPAQRVFGSVPTGVPAPPPPEGLVVFAAGASAADEPMTRPQRAGSADSRPGQPDRPGSPPVQLQRRPGPAHDQRTGDALGRCSPGFARWQAMQASG